MRPTKKNDAAALFASYFIWGFQPLYWALLGNIESLTIMPLRIVFAALFSVLILAFQKRLPELKAVFCDKSIMRLLLPAAVFLLADWTVFIVVVNSGHILDVSLGYYINPLILFAVGALIYKEHCGKGQIIALVVAAAGVAVSIFAFGSVPYISLVIAINWAVYAVIKKNVKLDGILSIAVETLILTLPAVIFMLFFKRQELAAIPQSSYLWIVGSGLVTALPMFLYSRCVSRLPLIIMCFAQYLAPTFNLICGYIRGESFSESQLTSFMFFITAIIIFTISQIKQAKQKREITSGN